MPRIKLILLLLLPVTALAQVPPPPAASTAEVVAGTVKNKYISPFTLKAAGFASGVTSNYYTTNIFNGGTNYILTTNFYTTNFYTTNFNSFTTNITGGTGGDYLIDRSDIFANTSYTNTSGSNLLVRFSFAILRADLSASYAILYTDDDANGTYQQTSIVGVNSTAAQPILQIEGNIPPGGRYFFTNDPPADVFSIQTGTSQRIYSSGGGGSSLSSSNFDNVNITNLNVQNLSGNLNGGTNMNASTLNADTALYRLSNTNCFFGWQGDSIMGGSTLSNLWSLSDRCALLDFFKGRGTMTNISVGGSGVTNMLDRYYSIMGPLLRAAVAAGLDSYVLSMSMPNDIASGYVVNTTLSVSNWYFQRSLIESNIVHDGGKCVEIGGLYYSNVPYSTVEIVDALNKLMRSNTNGYVYAYVPSRMVLPSPLDTNLFQGDFLHPTYKGQDQLAKLINSTMFYQGSLQYGEAYAMNINRLNTDDRNLAIGSGADAGTRFQLAASSDRTIDNLISFTFGTPTNSKDVAYIGVAGSAGNSFTGSKANDFFVAPIGGHDFVIATYGDISNYQTQRARIDTSGLGTFYGGVTAAGGQFTGSGSGLTGIPPSAISSNGTYFANGTLATNSGAGGNLAGPFLTEAGANRAYSYNAQSLSNGVPLASLGPNSLLSSNSGAALIAALASGGSSYYGPNFTNLTIYGSGGGTNWTTTDTNGWHNTNNSAANQGVDIVKGTVTAQAGVVAKSSGASSATLIANPITGLSSNMPIQLRGTNGTSGLDITDQGGVTNNGNFSVSGTSYLKGAVLSSGSIKTDAGISDNLNGNWLINIAGIGYFGSSCLVYQDQFFGWSSGGGSAARSRIYSPSDGAIQLKNNALTSFSFLSLWPNSTGPTFYSYGTAGNTNVALNTLLVLSNGVASYSTHTPVSLTIGASPFNFTNTTPNCMKYRFSGATAYSVSVNGVAVFGSLSGDIADTIQPTEYITVTYTVAPTCYTNSW